MTIFGHSTFIPVFVGKIVRKKFGTAIFAQSEFILVFLGKLSEKIWNSHFWAFQIYTSLCGRNGQKNLEQPFLLNLNLY